MHLADPPDPPDQLMRKTMPGGTGEKRTTDPRQLGAKMIREVLASSLFNKEKGHPHAMPAAQPARQVQCCPLGSVDKAGILQQKTNVNGFSATFRIRVAHES